MLRSVKLILGGRIRRDAEAGGFSLVDIEEILRRGLILWLEGLNARGEQALGSSGRDLANGLLDEIAVHALGRSSEVYVHTIVGHILIGVSRRRLEFVKYAHGLLRRQLLVEGLQRALDIAALARSVEL